jgi:hypothetical protein
MWNWWVASLVANGAIMGIEYANREATAGWTSVLPVTVPLIILAQWCLFVAFNGAPSWLWAWAVFTVGNCLMRLMIVGFIPHEAPTNWVAVLCGCTLMLGGTYLLKQGIPG